VLEGDVPNPIRPPTGCHFHPRCPRAFESCSRESPVLKEVAPGHVAACHLNDRVPAGDQASAGGWDRR